MIIGIVAKYLPADAFSTPPAALLSPSTRQHKTTTTFSRDSIAIDASACEYMATNWRVSTGGERATQMIRSRPGRPSQSSSSSDVSIPESNDGEEVHAPLGDTPLAGMSERDEMQEKLEVAEAPAPRMDRIDGGQTLKGQAELEGDKEVEDDDDHDDDHDAEVRGLRAK